MTGDNDVTHSSTVYYNRASNPFITYLDRVYWGGKPAEDLESWQFASEWKRDDTKYKKWDGNSWETKKTVKDGRRRDCGSADDGLCWWNLNNNVTLETSARVDQRLKYRYFYFAGQQLREMSW